MGELLTDESKTAEIEIRSIEILADFSACFTYASFQNAIPIIRSIVIDNPTAESFEGCRLELNSNPPFLRGKTWTLDRIIAGDNIPLSDRKIELDASYLAGLNEAERGEILLKLSVGEKLLAEKIIPVRLLARDEWGGISDMAQLLPAFVMPNDPAVPQILRSAADRLAAHGHPAGMDGYQTESPQRAFMLTAAIYSAVAGLGLHYAEPPASFESRGQKIRRPSTIVTDGLGTCLDTALLFAAAVEAVGLHPVLLVFEGHAAIGVWLTKRTLSNAVEVDAMELRKALALREMIVVETTGVTHRPPLTFERAQNLLRLRLKEEENPEFLAAIDVRRARSGGITPLASHQPAQEHAEEERESSIELPLPPLPPQEDMPAEDVEEKPTTAADRINRWQKKLLDLTLRNRLLNFPDTKKSIPFLCTNISDLEDRLAGGNAIRVISLPEQNPLGERDAELYREMKGHDLQREFAAEAQQRNELASTLTAKELEARLIELHRQVRNDFAEGGANTLFLAVGFLRWKKKPEDEKTYRAPLLLVPVKLERKSASSQFSLRFHEDEPRFNATLLQFLERDFQLNLPQFGGLLPVDENGVDVPRLLIQMRQAIRDVPGMEVVDETALSTFSFAKFLMWKDLVERTNALRQNRVVKHLIDNPDQPFSATSDVFKDERELDISYKPQDIISLLPADSSQIAASLAAAEGHDFVIVGPPGTGKSQTIANMIAHCLAVGKTVLFVAEKTAALDVVYRRLRERGLGEHCLELHSNKTDRKNFLGQLRKSWESKSGFDQAGWIVINDKLRLRRDQLNAYVAALHRRYSNGLTPYTALGIAFKGREAHAPVFSWPSASSHDEPALRRLREIARELGLVFRSVERRPVLDLIDTFEWSSHWQERLIAATTQLKERTIALRSAASAFQTSIGLKERGDIGIADIEKLGLFAQALIDSAGIDNSILLDQDFAKLPRAFKELEQAISAYRNSETELAASFQPDIVPRIPLDELDHDWRRAAASIWPMTWLGRRRVKKILQSYAEGGIAQPEKDLRILRQMQGHAHIIRENLLAGKSIGFAAVDSNLPLIKKHLDSADRIRESLGLLGTVSEERDALIQTITPILCTEETDDPIRRAASDLTASVGSFNETARQFAAVSGVDLQAQNRSIGLTDLVAQLEKLSEARHLLRDWTVWCSIRHQAVVQGLSALVEDMEAGIIPPEKSEGAFLLGYTRWWLPLILDADPTLREFRRFQHENAIEEFRKVDDLVRAAASTRVISALAHGLPQVQSVPRNSELGLLRHQMELQRPSRSIREMISVMPSAFSKLAPCMLMSPLSIAQYMPPDQALFDVVIFDEASQITTWDAVGAIARARQTVIVGDPKQLPPTNFFGRNENDEEVAELERDMESILDEAKAAGIPLRHLRWHYRSRSESLIAFSNYHYYQNQLVTFPSPNVEDRAVRFRHTPEGVYDRGKSRTNVIEARAVANEALKRMKNWVTLPEEHRPTLGIITFNAQQQSLIQDLLDEARRRYPDLEWFFSDERIEPTVVKNLENVQGDERDVMLFSITFTQDAAGKRSMDFGALNRDGGERRLNVAVTRARQELLVFSGFTADQIDTGRTRTRGVNDLKTFLDFAERGPIALPAKDEGSVGALESPFEEAVATELERLGWQIVPQVGISGFRVDIGIKHPDNAGAYLAGVECDGATYHSSATARDRDKVREQVLRSLGWNIVRIWSTDWWFDSKNSVERLHNALNELLEASRQKKAEHAATAEPAQVSVMDEENFSHQESLTAMPIDQYADITISPPLSYSEAPGGLQESGSYFAPAVPINLGEPAPPNSGAQTEADKRVLEAESSYEITDLSAFAIEPDRFHDDDYGNTLQAMINAILEREAPLREDILAQRITRAHGWSRTGNKIRDRINEHLRDVDKLSESSGVFVWKKGTTSDIIDYRRPASTDARRSVMDMPLAELASAAVVYRQILDETDSALALARVLGVERLSAPARSRLEEAIERAQEYLPSSKLR